jgi:hypothetical protein
MYTVEKEFIIEAHKAACSGWKAKLEEKFPDAFKVEVGRWYTSYTGGLWFIQKILGEDRQISYGFNYNGKWVDLGDRSSICLEPTHALNVEQHLIEEAIKRGYTKDNFICLIGGEGERFDGWHYCEFDNILYTAKKGYGGYAVFRDGKWAEIKDKSVELSMEEIAEKFGIKVEQLKIKK